MKKGWLVINSFLESEKFDEIYEFLLEAGKKFSFEIIKKKTIEVLLELNSLDFLTPNELIDFVIFWDKDYYLAKEMEEKGFKVFNSSEAIRICDDKALTHLVLSKANIPQPDTIIAPKAFSEINNFSFLEKVISTLSLPMIIKEASGSFGNEVYLVNSLDEMKSTIQKIKNKPFIFQSYISESKGKTIRVNIVGGKIVASMIFENKNDFRSNFAVGSYASPHDLSKDEKELALKTFKALKLDFAGIDILVGGEKPLVCEVNSNAQFKATLYCCHVNVAEEIMKHIKKKLSK